MTSIEVLLDMVLTEALLPNTHECLSCGHSFSPNEDGCPFCGINATVIPLDNLDKEE